MGLAAQTVTREASCSGCWQSTGMAAGQGGVGEKLPGLGFHLACFLLCFCCRQAEVTVHLYHNYLLSELFSQFFISAFFVCYFSMASVPRFTCCLSATCYSRTKQDVTT